MRKRLFKILAITMLLSAIIGCASAMSPVTGFLYTGVQGPIAYGENGTSDKSGTACATSILGIIGTGDASISGAMKKGGITKVTSIDHKTKSVLGIYAQFCTVVKGE